mgnify:CR=1 FL=1
MLAHEKPSRFLFFMKLRTSKPSWKAFWKRLPDTNISLKREKELTFDKAYVGMSKRLGRMGISETSIIATRDYFKKYKSSPHLQFYKFCIVFCLNRETIRRWVGSKDIQNAFIKFRKVVNGSRKNSDTKRDELTLLIKLVRQKKEISEFFTQEVSRIQL